MNYKITNLKQPEKICLIFKSFSTWYTYYKKN